MQISTHSTALTFSLFCSLLFVMASLCGQFACVMRKNFMVRRQQKIWLFVEIFVPPLLFLPFVLLNSQDSSPQPSCFYRPHPLPSAGVGNFLEGTWCNVGNSCSFTPYPDSHLRTEDENKKMLFRSVLEDYLNVENVLKDIGGSPCFSPKLMSQMNKTLNLIDYLNIKDKLRLNYGAKIQAKLQDKTWIHPKNDKDDFNCSKLKISARPIRNCWKKLKKAGVSEFAKYQLYTMLYGYILVTPDTQLVRKLVENLKTFARTIGTTTALFSDLTTIIDNERKGRKTPGLRMVKDFVGVLSACARYDDRFVFVKSERELEEMGVCLLDNYLYYSGLVFKNINQTMPKVVKYKIRMANWLVDSTERQSDFTWLDYYTRNKTGNYSKTLYYGFALLQDLVERSIILEQTGLDASKFKLGYYTQEFPQPCYRLRTFDHIYQFLLPCMLFLSWFFTFLMLVKNIVEEKEARLREIMTLMGLHGLVYYGSWFLQSLIIGLLAVVLILVTLTLLPFYLFERGNWVILGLLLVLSLLAVLSQALFFSTLFTNSSVASVTACGFYIVFYAPSPYLYTIRSSMPFTAKIISCLICQLAVSWGMSIAITWEEEGSGIQWHNINKQGLLFDEFNMQNVLIMLAIDTAVHLLLTWYFDAALSGQYKGFRRLTFFLFPSYWRQVFGLMPKVPPILSQKSDRTGPGDVHNEPAPSDLKMGVSISNLSKIYPNGTKAVNRLNLDFYESQVTSFLGHNGAGKTSTMSILSGLYPPTSGTAYVYGFDICKQFNSARPLIGLCPQYNILFDRLTVYEQLRFYSKLKGRSQQQTEREVNRMIETVGLKFKRNQTTASLSGGMKRRLCIAIAFLGDSKVIILDEPTAGVDPQSRRHIWDLLLEHKSGRTIILSTHHMDEADVLGDRIAIIKAGALLCCGSSLFLKKKFGSGYQVTMLLEPMLFNPDRVRDLLPYVHNIQLSEHTQLTSATESKTATAESTHFLISQVDFITSIVTQLLPGSSFSEHVANEVRYALATKEPALLKPFFVTLDLIREPMGIESYGISDTSMETIFLRVTGEDARDEALAPKNPMMPSILRKFLARFRKEKEAIGSDDYKENDEAEPTVQYVRALRIYRFRALTIKRFQYMCSNLFLTASQVFFPLALVIFSLFVAKLVRSVSKNEPEVRISSEITGYSASRPNIVFGSAKPPIVENYTKFFCESRFLDCPSFTVVPYNIPDTQCSCWNRNVSVKSDRHWHCDGGYKPSPKRNYSRKYHENVFDMSQRNITQWIMMTFEKYRLQRFGGYSLANVDSAALSPENVTRLWAAIDKGYKNYSKCGPPGPGAKCNTPLKLGKYALHNGSEQLKELLENLDTPFSIKIWHNPLLWPSVSIYMNQLNNLLLEHLKSDEYRIELYNHPLNYSKLQMKARHAFKIYDSIMNQVQPALITLALCILPASFALGLIQESVTGSKRLQMLSGVRPWLYWLNNFVFDFLFFVVVVSLCFLMLFAFEASAYVGESGTSRSVAGATALLFLLFGFGMIPVCYVFSLLFKQPSLGFVFLSVAFAAIGLMLTILSVIIDVNLDWAKTNDVAKWSFSLIPSFCLNRGLIDLALDDSLYKAQVAYKGKESASHKDMWELSFLGRAYFALFLHAIVSWAILLGIEYRHKLRRFRSDRMQFIDETAEAEDSDVSKERERVRKDDDSKMPLKVDELCKVYGSRRKPFVAVDRISFGVSEGECFGLLGCNGAGKTTTFKMLIGDHPITAGDASCVGYSVKNEPNDAYKFMGYCPQMDALCLSLTARQHLYFYARLRGIRATDLNVIVEWMLRHMNLTARADIAASKYSGGNRRKLSAAIALISQPSVVLLDEPSAGMDPKSRRFMWSRILSLVRTGKSVVLTSHSMEECEALCNRLAIMVAGTLRCLGSIQHLKSRFGRHLIVTLELGRQSSQDQMNELCAFIKEKLPSAQLKEQHGSMARYQLPTDQQRLSDILAVLEQLKVPLEDYSLNQVSLDDIFISFAQKKD